MTFFRFTDLHSAKVKSLPEAFRHSFDACVGLIGPRRVPGSRQTFDQATTSTGVTGTRALFYPGACNQGFGARDNQPNWNSAVADAAVLHLWLLHRVPDQPSSSYRPFFSTLCCRTPEPASRASRRALKRRPRGGGGWPGIGRVNGCCDSFVADRPTPPRRPVLTHTGRAEGAETLPTLLNLRKKYLRVFFCS